MKPIEEMTTEEKAVLLELLQEKKAREKYNKIDFFDPYEWQTQLCNATLGHNQMMLMAANRVGKSFVGGYLTAVHATGRYPDWWKGYKYTHPIYSWVSGVTGDTTRDIVQTELFGESSDDQALGTGWIPKAEIHKITKRRGASGNTYDSVLVKHYTNGMFDGYSRIGFKSYEMGEDKFFGRALDWIWLDEQPPHNIYTQCITRTADKKDGKVLMTFTPEHGMTDTIVQFREDRKPGQFYMQVGWDEVKHLSQEKKEQLLSQYAPHERKLRTTGEPVFGSGLVFPISPDSIECGRFEIPEHWKRIAGLDFGFGDHPTAAVWMAHDPVRNIVYVYDIYRVSDPILAIHAAAIRSKPGNVPVAWPHDGMKHDTSGKQIAELYREAGVNMLPEHFRNPTPLGEKKGDIAREPGITALLKAMTESRFKVFSDCIEWWDEFRLYHRQDGKIVDIKDDLMSATRYAYQSLQYAETPTDEWGSVTKQPSFGYIV